MNNNYYFLRQLSAELEKKAAGAVVSECFSQSKDELIIRFETASKPFFIRASLQADFCCLSFPEDFNRARKNSVDLFGDLIGQRVQATTQFNNERSFTINFSNEFRLLFKMHGNRANLILFHEDKSVELFRNHLTTDADIVLENLNRAIDWSYETFEASVADLQKLYFTFGKPIWNFLARNNFEEKSVVEKWQSIQDLLNYLKKPGYYITEVEGKLLLSLFPDGDIIKQFKDPLQASNEFFIQYTVFFAFYQEKKEIIAQLTTRLHNGLNYLVKTNQKKKELEKDIHYKTWADVVMANLHQIKLGEEKIRLNNFYNDNKPIEIKLKKDLSAQKNAEVFYRKAKNQQIEIQKLTEGFIAKQKQVASLQEKLAALEKIEDLKSLRSFIASTGLKQETEKKENPLPYHEVEYNGFKIWIGKNAQHNDTLTLKYTFKEDLWLHAKDVPGSHVVIKYQSGKKFPKDVIERAAQLAAFNSKRKTESLCPVAYTSKKFVRKRKGDPAGAVVVEREEVILVEPRK
ncbi:MAG TPA: NFACT RNA binding domain-containing protein [Cyclobacteriaceae bacterium]|nr:NFACT RNA binding domain-containing protein [Cyclobacteriaceae bacterium]